ncbi:hypothetical protein [Chryseobacterium jejuense]|uniref:Lipoprotein n=1 Tax=Chryseobacterium jejuense TaxID=445960 RepID=A0A2X2XND0_CHRJE|nr:hypothetical protein [Chryseobacterium jejuense]SDJ11040.1 hypothetical protein SAMN05421542_2676 [Chryseobacterium jejuense]SQB27910.1 Uncharacterised protein [Chryseobacterium jejuense]
MQKNLYLIIILFSLTSCYTYQVKKQTNTETNNKQEPKRASASANMASLPMESTTTEFKSKSSQQPAAPINIQEKLSSNKNVKIDVDGKSYKVIVDKWEGDSLVAHPVHNAKKTLKFHKNQINAEKIAEKRFSQPIADIITVVAYAGIAAGIYFLVR